MKCFIPEFLTSFETRPEIDDEDLRELKETLSKILGGDGETKKIRRHFVSQDTGTLELKKSVMFEFKESKWKKYRKLEK